MHFTAFCLGGGAFFSGHGVFGICRSLELPCGWQTLERQTDGRGQGLLRSHRGCRRIRPRVVYLTCSYCQRQTGGFVGLQVLHYFTLQWTAKEDCRARVTRANPTTTLGMRVPRSQAASLCGELHTDALARFSTLISRHFAVHVAEIGAKNTSVWVCLTWVGNHE